VIDGQEGPEYDGISYCVFSPDSKRVACVVLKGRKWCVVIDGKEGPEYNGISAIAFSGDSRHFVYIAEKRHASCMVIDAQEGPLFDGFFKNNSIFNNAAELEYLAHKNDDLYRVRHTLGEGAH